MNRFKFILLLVGLLPWFASFGQTLDTPHPSSVLITTQDWRSVDPAAAQGAITALIRQAVERGVSTVFFEIPFPASAYFGSARDIWERWPTPTNPDFAVLTTAIAACQTSGTKMWAVVNLFALHPWHPKTRDYLAKTIPDLVGHNGLDGIVFDCRALPGAIDLDPASLERFFGRGNPARLEQPEWLKSETLRAANHLIIRGLESTPQLAALVVNSEDNLPWSGPPVSVSKSQCWATGTVRDENGRGIGDVQISLKNQAGDIIASTLSDSDGWYGFSQLKSTTQLTAIFQYDGLSTQEAALTLTKSATGKLAGPGWDMTLPGAAVAAARPWLTLIRPLTTTRFSGDSCNILGRTFPNNRIYLTTQPHDGTGTATRKALTVLTTGAFFLDHLPLQPGINNFLLTVENPQGQTADYPFQVCRIDPASPEELARAAKAVPPSDDFTIISPVEDQLLLSGEILELRLKGPSNWTIVSSGFAGKVNQKLQEIPDPEQPNSSEYLARIKIPDNLTVDAQAVVFLATNPKNHKQIKVHSPGSVAIHNSLYPLIAEALTNNTAVRWGLHMVRLDGPYAAEVNQGTRFIVVGKIGSKYQVQLSKNLTGWVEAEDVRLLPLGTPSPHGYSTFCEVSGTDSADRIWIALAQPVPWAITPQVDRNGNWQLDLDFFNSHFAIPWFSHRESRKLVGFIRGEQVEDDWFRLTIPVSGKQLWGYTMEAVKDGFWLTIKHPPLLHTHPLEGLTLALDAGHGGDKTGAIGYMGTQEKTINSLFCADLAAVLREHGAKTVMVRPTDFNTPFDERLKTAEAAKAALILSIHANAGDMSDGFAALSGPSVYYKYDFSRSAAECIYAELIKLFGKGDGLVGNFNFNLLRRTSIPDVLVELAYLSNPTEEAQLLDHAFRKKVALAIVRGLENYLASARS